MKARIKSNGKIVEVISRFMPRKRNAASRDWVCNLSDGTCIDESQLEYIEESIDGLDEAADHYASVTDQEAHGIDFIREVFIAGAEWQEEQDLKCIFEIYRNGYNLCKEQMMKEAVEGEVMLNPYPIICLDDCKDYNFKDAQKVRIIIIKED